LSTQAIAALLPFAGALVAGLLLVGVIKAKTAG
jgi:hypothetical protein